VATNYDTVWVAKSSVTIAENDKIEKIGVKIGTAAYNQPYGLKLVAYTNTSNLPDKFICMTESHVVSDPTTGYVDYDIVNGSGSIEAHTITAAEAGYIWLGNWSDKANELCFNLIGAGLISWQMDSQTYNASNTVTPDDPFSLDVNQYPWQLRGRLTICEV